MRISITKRKNRKITLKAAYVETLSDGPHVLTVIFRPP